MILPYLIEKEFKQIRRDHFLPKILFILPIMQLLILPLAANFEMRNINLSIVDEDRSETSRRLTEQVLSSGYFNGVSQDASYADALKHIEDNTADIILHYPLHMERDMKKDGTAEVLVAANAINGTKGGLGSGYLSGILTQAEGGAMPLRFLNNPHLNYQRYMVPGIIAFLLTLIGGFVSALNIVSEKEKGTIEQMNVSPVPKHIFLLSKLIPFWIIGFVELTLAFLVAWVAYGLVPEGDYIVLYLFASVYLLFATGFGLAISSVSNTQQQAMFTAFFFLIIFALLSGLFTPITSMPEWAQRITLFNPIRYFVEVLRMVFLKGSGLADLSRHFFVVACFALGVNALAVVGYRKKG